MTPGEVYHLRRRNFIEKSSKNFEFLVSDFGFMKSKHVADKQSNGSIIRDSIEYDRKNKKITISNAYHPVDYGFQIDFTTTETGQTELLHYLLKENQDIEQNYLQSASKFLRRELDRRLKLNEL